LEILGFLKEAEKEKDRKMRVCSSGLQ
jgi:hypothetical protein